MADPIRIAIVDDHPALLMGLSGLLGNDGRYLIVGTGGTADEALELARQNARAAAARALARAKANSRSTVV